MIKWLLFALILGHGLIHALGFMKAFGLAELSQLNQPISRAFGLLWLFAAVAFVASGALFVAGVRWWWIAGLVAIVVSQAVIVTAWGDAKVGTVANALILVAVVYGFASMGPWSFRAQYEDAISERLSRPGTPSVVTEEDLAPLPRPVQEYLRVSGAVGRPRARHFEARWNGRIRQSEDAPWMEFQAKQVNFIDDPARFFIMDAKMHGLPVDVLHAFHDVSASMQVKLFSLVPMVNVSGEETTHAETVTLFNDICLLAPSALVAPSIRWESIDERSARGHFTNGPHSVSAVLTFNEAGELVNFVSDDRLALLPDGSGFRTTRWSTPVGDYRDFGGRRVCTRGEGLWHPPEGSFSYIELELLEHRING